MGETTVRPDRTERLVHTLLRSDLLDTQEVDTAQAIVAFARELERAIDGSKTENLEMVSLRRHDLQQLSDAIEPGSPWDPIKVVQLCQQLMSCGK